MRKKVLSEPDRRAVDLLLNHACSVATAGHCDPVPHQRIEAVQRLLAILDQMPPVEAPTDLVTRTMARIDREFSPVINPTADVQSRPALN